MGQDIQPYKNVQEHAVALITEKNSDIDNALLMNKLNMIVAKTPKVAQMSAEQISQAILKAMIPDPTLQNHDDIYFVPYGQSIDVSFSHNYLQKLAYRNGAVKLINTYLIYQNDIVEITQEGLTYKVLPFGDQGDFVGVLVDIKLASGEHKYGTVTKEHIDNARKASKSGANGPWKTWYHEMAKKVALKNTLKGIDISKEFADAVAIDNEDTDFSKLKVIDVAPEASNALEDMMKDGNTSMQTVENGLLGLDVIFTISGDWVMIDEETLPEGASEKMNLRSKEGKEGKLFGKIAEIEKYFTGELDEDNTSG